MMNTMKLPLLLRFLLSFFLFRSFLTFQFQIAWDGTDANGDTLKSIGQVLSNYRLYSGMDFLVAAIDKAKDTYSKVVTKSKEFYEKAKEKVEEAQEKLKETYEKVKEKTQEVIEQTFDGAGSRLPEI